MLRTWSREREMWEEKKKNEEKTEDSRGWRRQEVENDVVECSAVESCLLLHDSRHDHVRPPRSYCFYHPLCLTRRPECESRYRHVCARVGVGGRITAAKRGAAESCRTECTYYCSQHHCRRLCRLQLSLRRALSFLSHLWLTRISDVAAVICLTEIEFAN